MLILIVILIWIITSVLITINMFKPSRDPYTIEMSTAGNIITSIILSIIAFVIIGIITIFFVLFCFTNITTKEVLTNRTEIYALGDSDAVSGKINGNIFLISGELNTKVIYKMVREDRYGGKEVFQIDNGYHVSIFEDNKNVLLEYRMQDVRTCDKKYKSFLGIFYREIDYTDHEDRGNKSIRYEIHVPKGSITRNFNVDLK